MELQIVPEGEVEDEDDPPPLTDSEEDDEPQHNNNKYDDDSDSDDDENLMMAFPDLVKKFNVMSRTNPPAPKGNALKPKEGVKKMQRVKG
eukprot:12406282-Karenia_brevis.AAC.1